MQDLSHCGSLKNRAGRRFLILLGAFSSAYAAQANVFLRLRFLLFVRLLFALRGIEFNLEVQRARDGFGHFLILLLLLSCGQSFLERFHQVAQDLVRAKHGWVVGIGNQRLGCGLHWVVIATTTLAIPTTP